MRIVVLGSDPDYLVNLRGDLLRQIVREGGEAVGAAPAPADGEHARALQAMGVRFEPVRLVRNQITPLRDAATALDLYKMFKRVKPDALLAYTIKPVVYGCPAARRAGVRTVAALIPGVGGSFEGKGWRGGLRNRLVETLFRNGMRSSDVVFFQNPDDQQEFLTRKLTTPTQRTVLLNGSGVNLERFNPAPLPAQPAFVWVGRLLEEKGLGVFVAAAKLVRRTHPNATFRVVGYNDGRAPNESELSLRAAAAAGDVEFVGKVADIRPELERCTAFVLPSWYREGVPRSALEALAMGRAVITTDCIGCREVVRKSTGGEGASGKGASGEGANGIIVPPRDAEAVARAVLRLIEEPGLAQRMGAASRAYAEERFDVRVVNRTILENLGLPCAHC